MRLIKTTLFLAVLLFLNGLQLTALPTSIVSADGTLNPVCERYDVENDPNAPAICRQDSETGGQTIGDNNIFSFMAEVISILTLVLSIAGVIGVTVGGLLYVISAGDPQKIQTARKAIIYSLVGVAIGVSAQLILRFVLATI